MFWKFKFLILLFVSLVFSAETKIISLAPNLTEIVCYLGGEERLVGITNDCNYPPSITKLPKVGKYTYPDIEKIIALQPATVIAEDTADKRFLKKLRQQKIKYKTYRLVRLKDLQPAMDKIAKDFNLQRKVIPVKKNIAFWGKSCCVGRGKIFSRPTSNFTSDILIIIWEKPLIAAGRETFISDYYALQGWHNILPGGYSKIDPELLLKPGLYVVRVTEDRYLRLGPRLLENK